MAGKSQPPARSVVWSRYISLALVACYAAGGAAVYAYVFYLSAQSAQVTPHPAHVTLRPGWMATGSVILEVLAGWVWMELPLPLLIIGLVRTGRAGLAGWRWPAAWAGAVAAGIALEVLLMTGANANWLFPDYPYYPPPPGLSWVSLAESAGFLLVGAVMTGVLIGAERWARRQPA